MQMTIERPECFDEGVWSVTVVLEPNERQLLNHEKLTFLLPHLDDRLFRVESDFLEVTPAGNEHPTIGKFVNGNWKGIVQANGCAENECRTSIKQIEDAVTHNISESILALSK